MFIEYFKIISSFFSKLFGENRFAYSVKVYPIQKYPHITESYACILKMFVLMFLFCEAEDKGGLINALISFRICSTPKESK